MSAVALLADERDAPARDAFEPGESLTPRLTVAECVRVYEQANDDIREAFERIDAAVNRLNEVFSSDYGSVGITTSNMRFDDPDRALLQLRKDVWTRIIGRLEVRRMMSISARKQLDEQIASGDMPPITNESVSAVLRGFESSLGTMLEQAIEEVFDWLRPPRSEYKTNSELEIGKRVVLTWMVEETYAGEGFRVNYTRSQHLQAMENVFSALGGNGQISKDHYSALEIAIKESGSSGVGRTPYFAFRCCKNRNLHVEFLRLDLLKKFNAIAGGMRLRPATRGAGK